MAISTYAELQTAIGNFLLRDDLTSVIPDFITLAEAQIKRDVRHYKMHKRQEATLDSRYSALPADWIETRRIEITRNSKPHRLQLASIDDMLQMRESADTSGAPRYYSHTDEGIELFPTPDDEYDVEIYYFGTVEALSDSNTSNWLLTFAPDVYLYGSLIHSAPYLQEDPRAQTWGSLYMSAVANLNTQSRQSMWGGSGKKKSMRL